MQALLGTLGVPPVVGTVDCPTPDTPGAFCSQTRPVIHALPSPLPRVLGNVGASVEEARDWVCWRVGFWRTSPLRARGPWLLVRKALRLPGYGLESRKPPAPPACGHGTVGAWGCPLLRLLSLSRFQRRWGRW